MSIIERRPTERELDEALAATFPASDPVALHFSDDPVPTRRMQIREQSIAKGMGAVALSACAAAGALSIVLALRARTARDRGCRHG